MGADPVGAHAINLLLADDSPADVRLIQEALRGARLINRVMVAADGVEALALLRKQGRYADAARPDLILLDLNLPKKDGIAVLEEIKGDPHLKRIPVVVLTSSTAEQDVVKSYELQANCYISKPIDLESFVQVVRAIEDFWAGIVRLPPQ